VRLDEVGAVSRYPSKKGTTFREYSFLCEVTSTEPKYRVSRGCSGDAQFDFLHRP